MCYMMKRFPWKGSIEGWMGMDVWGGGLDALKTLSTMHACYFSIANDTADQRANLIEV